MSSEYKDYVTRVEEQNKGLAKELRSKDAEIEKLRAELKAEKIKSQSLNFQMRDKLFGIPQYHKLLTQANALAEALERRLGICDVCPPLIAYQKFKESK